MDALRNPPGTLQRNGPHVVKTDPSADVVETLATSIGARSQSARTYLERHLEHFPNGMPALSQSTVIHRVLPASTDQLIEHALLALRDTLPAEDNLTKKVGD